MKAKGLHESEIHRLLVESAALCSPPLLEREALAIVASIMRYEL